MELGPFAQHCATIPGARTAKQAIQNAQSLAFGPLSESIMDEIELVLDRPAEGPPRER